MLPSAVVASQTRFADSMSTELTQAHPADLARCGISSRDVAALTQLLTAPQVVKLALTLMNFLYCRLVSRQWTCGSDSHQALKHPSITATADRHV